MTEHLTATGGGYAPDGWQQWPDDPHFSSQFLRILAAAPEGACAVGEVFQTAGRITAGDRESWHAAWSAMGERSQERAAAAEAAGHRHTARANWVRAANYFRSAEFFLDPHDARRLPAFERIEAASHRALTLGDPPGEVVHIAYGDGDLLDAYFLRSPVGTGPRPVVIAFGGLDEFKDELIQEMERYALPRGMSLLLVDLPGQGGPLRRRGTVTRPDTEVPVAACVDYVQGRADVDADRIGLYGASLGGYYVMRAAAFEHRLRCAVSDAAQWKLVETARALAAKPDDFNTALTQWVFGASTPADLVRIAEAFDLEPVVSQIACPVLIVSGTHDPWGAENARKLYAALEAANVAVAIKWFTPEETGAAHCQIDNPALGQEYLCDWLADHLVAPD